MTSLSGHGRSSRSPLKPHSLAGGCATYHLGQSHRLASGSGTHRGPVETKPAGVVTKDPVAWLPGVRCGRKVESMLLSARQCIRPGDRERGHRKSPKAQPPGGSCPVPQGTNEPNSSELFWGTRLNLTVGKPSPEENSLTVHLGRSLLLYARHTQDIARQILSLLQK